MDGAFLWYSDQICCALHFLAAFNGVAFGFIFYPYCFFYTICLFPLVNDSCLLISMHYPFCPYFHCLDKLGENGMKGKNIENLILQLNTKKYSGFVVQDD
jgi:hypothetical protein